MALVAIERRMALQPYGFVPKTRQMRQQTNETGTFPSIMPSPLQKKEKEKEKKEEKEEEDCCSFYRSTQPVEPAIGMVRPTLSLARHTRQSTSSFKTAAHRQDCEC